MSLCQYCNAPRTARGYVGLAPVSLCTAHVRVHERDFDRVVHLTDAERAHEAEIRNVETASHGVGP